MMFTVNVPKFLWNEVVMRDCTFSINCTSSYTIGIKSQCEFVFIKKVPLKVFGCTCFVRDHKSIGTLTHVAPLTQVSMYTGV